VEENEDHLGEEEVVLMWDSSESGRECEQNVFERKGVVSAGSQL